MKKRLTVLVCLVFLAAVVYAQLPILEPRDAQWKAWTTPVALHKQGCVITYNNGTLPSFVRYLESPAGAFMRLFGVRIIPWKETPANYADWEPERTRRVSPFCTALLPGLKAGSFSRGPQQILANGQVQFESFDPATGDADRFIPPFTSADEVHAYVDSLPEPTFFIRGSVVR